MPEERVTTVERHANMIVVHVLREKLDEGSLSALRVETVAAGTESPQLPVALDLAKVNFVPSLSLGGLVQLSREFKVRGQRLVLLGLQPTVRQTITITRLDRLFEILDDASAM